MKDMFMDNLKKVIRIFSVLSFSFVCINRAYALTGIVNTPAARVREKPSTNSEIIETIYEDDEVEIVEEEDNWYKVKVNGNTGYVSKPLIKASNESASLTATNTNTNTASTNTSSNNAKTNTSKENTNTNKATNTENTNTAENTNTSKDTNTVEENTTNSDGTENSEFNKVINRDAILRLLPNFGSNELRVLTKDVELKVEKELNKWAKITLSDNTSGWVLKNSISDRKVSNTENDNTSKENTNTNTSNTNTSSEDTNKVANNTTNTNANTTNTTGKNTANTSSSNNTVADNTSVEKNSKGKVNVETANVREKPSTSSNIIERLDEGDEVTILEQEGDWYKITSSKVSSGYVSKNLITIFSSDVSSRSSQESRDEAIKISENSTNGAEVVEFAKNCLGASYVLGGKTPETGFDCSGFTRYVFKNFGYSLGTVASEQDSVGTAIKREDLKPGDLILFYNEEKTKIGHTGIYIGNNEFIHAANPERGVVIDNLETTSYYSERFVSARRIVE